MTLDQESTTRMKLLLLLLLPASGVHAARILALFSLISPSHNIFNRALTRALAARGHQVTEICPDAVEGPHPNISTVLIENPYAAFHAKYDYGQAPRLSALGLLSQITEMLETYCDMLLSTRGVRELVGQRFDLVLSEASVSECLYALLPGAGSPPVVAVSAHGVVPWLAPLLGTPEHPAYVPHYLLPYPARMGFQQRVNNFLLSTAVSLYYQLVMVPAQEAVARRVLQGAVPRFHDVQRNLSLYLANIALGLDEPRPLSPNVIPVGGMHLRTSIDPLPQALQTFLDGAEEGFIYFSVGVSLQGSMLDSRTLTVFVEAFSKLPQRVIWKFETGEMEDLPSNVRIEKWVPQEAVLAHPKAAVFVSQCGRLSLLEAVRWAVPLVGMPLVMDQHANVRLLEERGAGVRLDFHSLSTSSILHAIHQVSRNKSYRDNMRRLSAVFRDEADSALARAVFWTEYVIRHGGAPHLRPAGARLPWHQFLLLDVLLVLVTGFAVTCYALAALVRAATRKRVKTE